MSPGLSVGTRFSSYVILAPRGEGDYLARDVNGVTVLVAIGTARDLAYERSALEALGGNGAFPRFLARGNDAEHGAYVVLTAPAPASRSLDAVAAALSLSQVIAVLRQILDAGASLDRAGRSFRPLTTDFHLEGDDVLRVARARGATPAREGDRIDARGLLEGVGRRLLEGAALRGRPRLIRLLQRRGVEGSMERTIREVRRELDALARDFE